MRTQAQSDAQLRGYSLGVPAIWKSSAHSRGSSLFRCRHSADHSAMEAAAEPEERGAKKAKLGLRKKVVAARQHHARQTDPILQGKMLGNLLGKKDIMNLFQEKGICKEF